MTDVRAVLGIDLGTSNSAVAFCDVEGSVSAVSVPQLVTSDGIAERKLLPSTLFSPPANELPSASLPWEGDWSIGEFARDRAVFLPGRAVTSSKSWLCNPLIDRRAALLPWQAEEGAPRLSAYDAAVSILSHLRGAVARGLPNVGETSGLPLVLTVPASFEESARTLTYEAAVAAGFSDVVLLEEPLAALYAWFESHGSGWRNELAPGDLICVCDVGGGTCDFSFIAVEELEGTASFRRVSVGDHILLGGDNMDLALAHTLRQRLDDEGTTIDQWQFLTLVHGSRLAKEALLGSNTETNQFTISIPSRGGSLFGGTSSIEISRVDAERIIVEGFFPFVNADDAPRSRKGPSLREFGLPYAADAAITRHLAGFLALSSRNAAQDEGLSRFVRDGRLRPTKVLFNGGVFESTPFRERILEQLSRWGDGNRPAVLENSDTDSAVARGAAYYGGVVSRGSGLRIRAGLGRSYYIGLEPTELAVPGISLKTKGLCVAPRGLEEGTSCDVGRREFVLAGGEEAEFPLFSSNERPNDGAGAIVTDAERELEPAGSVKVRVEASEPYIPVTLESRVTEVGTLELSLRDITSARSWKLEFDVRTGLE